MVFRTAAKVVAFLFALALLVGVLPAQVVVITGDSMEPTITQGDVALVHQTQNVEEGDIVVFYSPERGEDVAHRIVDTTENGFITQGDNNPSTDQAGGLPPIEQSQVQGKVVTLFGGPVTLPTGEALGALLERPAAVSSVLGVLLISLLLLRKEQPRGREGIEEVGDVIRPLLLIAFVAMVVFIQIGAATTTVAVLYTEDGGPQPTIQQVGEETSLETEFTTRRPPFSHRVIATDGPISMGEIERGTEPTKFNATISVEPRTTEGIQRGTVTVHSYPAVLPKSVMVFLNAVHPLLAAVTVSAVIFMPVWLIYLLVIDPKELFRESGNRKGDRNR